MLPIITDKINDCNKDFAKKRKHLTFYTNITNKLYKLHKNKKYLFFSKNLLTNVLFCSILIKLFDDASTDLRK